MFDDEGKEVEIYHQIYRIESEEGVKGWSETSGVWQPWYQSKPEIQARVITKDGVVHLLDQKTLNDVAVHENSPDTYGDNRRFGGPLPAVAVGAIVEEEIIIRDTNAFFSGRASERVMLDRHVAVNRTHIVLSYPSSLPLRYKLLQVPEATIKKSTSGNIETVEIEQGPLEARARSFKYVPYDVVMGPQFEFSTGTSWQAVASGYARLANEKTRLADVQSIVQKATTRSASRDEKIRKLVSFLHSNVRYTGVEFGEASWIPQFPSETLTRKYGDCKDKANLLVALLRAAGIPANLALLDSGPGQDVNPELPGTGSFDHEIVYVPSSQQGKELWLDATANYTRVGDLPYMDYGRWALVIDDHTTELRRIPELQGEQNFHREIREFTLAEYGPAKIVERNEQIGPAEAQYREYYDGDAKALREEIEAYVKRAYLADTLGSMEHSSSLDLEKPFWVTFTTKGKRASTDYENAVAAIRIEDLFSQLPNYFVSDDPEDTGSDPDEDDVKPDKAKPRTVDWLIKPYVHEWDYKIIAPSGYKLRALPPSKEERLGSAKLTQSYSAEEDGRVVKAVLRFDSGKSRLTVEEAKTMREALSKARKAEPILISFDLVGHTQITAGKIREGLETYQRLASSYPKSALRRVQLARALLSVGLAEKARAVAKEAIAVEPGSSQAYYTLGWILEHDLMGRRFKKGFDYEGALSAYRKAKELAPRDKEVRVNLAILLETDAQGDRYTSQAHLKEAIAEFMELKKLDENYFRSYEDNVPYDLWYLRNFKGVVDAVAALPPTDARRGLLLAAIATQGVDSAIQKSLEITTDESIRSKALINSGWLLARVNKYSEAADMFTAGAKGQNSEGPAAGFVAALKKAKPRDEFKFDESQPASAMLRLFASMFQREAGYSQVKKAMSSNALREAGASGDSEKKNAEDFRKTMYGLRQQIEKNGIPIQVIGDVVLANARITVEGSDSDGYRLTVISLGAAPQNAFAVRENGGYKLLTAGGPNQVPEAVGWQVLDEAAKGNLKTARHWLDWVREEVHMSSGDDPLQGQPFPYFWTKGEEGDSDAIKTAALVLIPSKSLNGDNLAELLQSRQKLKTDELKARLDVVIASAYQSQDKWQELGPVAERLLKAFPESNIALRFVNTAYASTGRLDDWDKLITARLAVRPDDADNIRSAAALARNRRDFVRARELMKKMIDRGTATQSDLNLYAWDALFIPGPIGTDAIEAAERANELSKGADFSILHTLTCVYARGGKGVQAKNLLIKAMDVGHLEEPDSPVWLAYGQIAEEFGENDAASTLYARVESQKINLPGSNYDLAKLRLAALGTAKTSVLANGTR